MKRSWAPVSATMAGLALLLAALLSPACAPTDPLDEKVDAATMNGLLRWQARHVNRLGEPVAGEFARALIVIARKTPGYRPPGTDEDFASPFNPLCRRIDGQPLRRVLVDGYELMNDSLRDRIFLDQRNVQLARLRMAEMEVDLNPHIARYEHAIQQRTDEIRSNEARIRELRGARP